MVLRSLAVAAAVLLPTGAEAQVRFTTPAGFLHTEGNSASPRWMSQRGSGSWQWVQVDATVKGVPIPTIRALHYRRDGNLPGYHFPARTVTFGVRMAHADWNAVRFEQIQPGGPDGLVVGGGWTYAFTRQRINLPDWSATPTQTPDPFSVRVPLDRPFSYNGNDALLMQWISYGASNSTDNYPCDMTERGRLYNTSASGSAYGTGCIATGRSTAMTVSGSYRVYGPRQATEWDVSVRDAPANQPLTLLTGVTRQSIPVPGLCTNLLTDPVNIALPLGVSDAAGSRDMTIAFRHEPAYVGMRPTMQVMANDPGRAPTPITASRGYEMGAYPRGVVLTQQYAGASISSSSTGYANSAWFWQGDAFIVGIEN